MSTIADRLRNLYDSMVIANSVTNEFVEALPDCYDAVEEKGGTIPAQQTAANLPTAIASIPSGDPNPYGDLSWWTSSAFSREYGMGNTLAPNDYAVASPFLTKNPSDNIRIDYSFFMSGSRWHNDINPSFCTGAAAENLCISTYNSNYQKIDYWQYSHVSGQHSLGSAAIFRVFSTIYLVRYMRIVNMTSGDVYWQGDRYTGYSVDNELSKANLIKCINAELGQNCYMYLSATKYAELATDSDVIAALASKPNVTLVQAT